MTGEAAPQLTDKQREVMHRIDRRMPIKLIASEMGVSETRINQHIRALKRIYDAGSLNELVRILPPVARAGAGQRVMGRNPPTIRLFPPLAEPRI